MLENLSHSSSVPDILNLITFAMDVLANLPKTQVVDPILLDFSPPIEVDISCACGCSSIVEVYSLGTFHCISCGKQREVL